MDQAENKKVPSPNSDINEALKACQAERDEYLNGWRRAKADLINFQAATEAKLEEVAKFANTSILRDLINILNSFDLALLAEPDNVGLFSIKNQLENFLAARGLTPLDVLGKIFDPALAEAVGFVDSAEPPDTVVEVVERGWQLHDKVICPAKVNLAKTKN